MKSLRPKVWALLGLILCLTSAVIFMGFRRHSYPAGDWLQVAAPVFGTATNADGRHGLMVVLVSNTGPTAIEFQLRWFDCRSKRDPTSAAAPRSSSTGRTLVPSRSDTRVAWDFGSNTPGEEYLCCCAFDWQQHPSWLWHAAARWIDPVLVWVQNCVQPGWKPYSWSLADRLEPLAYGLVFTSNVEVDDYFSSLYGLNRVQSPGEDAQRRLLTATNAAGPVLSDSNTFRPLVASLDVHRAFNSYCVLRAQQPGKQTPPASSKPTF